jgi:signal transduction histidine kinase
VEALSVEPRDIAMSEDRAIPLRDVVGGDRFHEIVAVIADGVVVVDREGVIRFANPAAGELLGSTADELIGRDFGFPVVVDEATEIELLGREPIVVEMRTVEIDWEGEPAALASLRDITWRAQLAMEQETAIERLRELDALKNDFVAMVSHDLRSPMATISGFADTLRINWDAFDDAHKMEILDRISRTTDHLAKLVENILQVAQIESGRFKYDIKPFDFERLVERTVDEARRINPHRRHDDSDLEERKIVLRVEDDLPQVKGDELRQWQVLTNLLSNALKFSPPEESVIVDVTRQEDQVQIAIQDHGLGIKDKDKDKLFKKFSRLEQPKGQKIKGTGLGLYICKNMIEAQGGRVWVESEPGEGTTFFYTVPVA